MLKFAGETIHLKNCHDLVTKDYLVFIGKHREFLQATICSRASVERVDILPHLSCGIAGKSVPVWLLLSLYGKGSIHLPR